MNKRYDWDTVAVQMHEHLDSLDEYQRPINEVAWVHIIGTCRSAMRGFASRNPTSPLATALRRSRQLDAQWRARLTQAIADAGAGKGHLVAVAKAWGLTREQLKAFKRYNAKDLVVRRQPLTVADFLRHARVGMTRAELAEAMGRPARTVEDYLLHYKAGKPGAVTRRLKALIKWEGSGSKPRRIAAIGWELKHGDA